MKKIFMNKNTITLIVMVIILIIGIILQFLLG